MSRKCATCMNKSTNICHDCIFDGNIERINRYTVATPERIAQRMTEEERMREQKRKMAEELMCQDYLNIYVSEEFRETFNKAKLFSSQDPDNIKFMSVWARDDVLVASNSYMICELHSSIPFLLQNRYITRIEPFRVWFATEDPTTLEPLKIFPKDYDESFTGLFTEPILDLWSDLRKISKQVTPVNDNTELIKLTLGKNVAANTVIYINPYFLETTKEALGDINCIKYTDNKSSVIFHSKIGRVAIMPIVGSVFNESYKDSTCS